MIYKLNDKVATREAFGAAILKFGGKFKNVIVLDADLASSLKTQKFAQIYPERYLNFGIAESNMVTAAAGMAIRGKVPFACSFAIFATGRAWEFIRNAVCYPNLNVKIVGSHAGVLTGEDGATHQALEDIAIMRAIPNMKVICPADANEAYLAVEEIIKDFGPTYLRLGRASLPVIYDSSHKFKIGYADILTFGEDICIFATGPLVHSCLEAAKKLKERDIHTTVVNISTIKPLDEKLVIDCAKKCKIIVTAEDHQITGGLGSAVMEVLSENYPKQVHRIGMEKFGESGKPEDLYKKYGLDAEGVYSRLSEWLTN
ncbi:transketolase family protein [Candidatus Peregrinibacteria bacterium]|nr:transketolase family protein [Candidatus Peregrinibacteria bacterium]